MAATLSAGSLDRKITIQRFTSTVNEYNEPVQVWTDFISYRAQRKDVSDGEKYAAGAIGSSLRSRFIIRSTVDSRTVTPVDRLVHDGFTWNILGVKQSDQARDRFIEITAERRAEP
jgi:SPP1 family predicted phage head-tail adaptor